MDAFGKAFVDLPWLSKKHAISNPMFSEPETRLVKMVSVGVSLVGHWPLVSFHDP